MVAVPQVQIPNFVGTLGQVEQIQQSRLQAMAARQAMEEAQRFNDALPSLAPALMAGEGPAYDAAVARLGGMGARGLQVALPLMQDARLRREFQQWQGGGGMTMPQVPAAPAGGDPMQRIAAVESGGNDAARNPRSSAAGRFQIIDSTWRQYAPRLGLTDAQRMDPQAQEAVARAIQADARQAVGRDLSPGEAYGAHFLGIGGLRAFLGADPNADAQQVYAQAAGPQVAAQAFRANPGLLEPGMTVGQVMEALNRRMGAGGAATPVSAPSAAPASRQGIDPAELRRIEMGLASPNPMIQRAAQARLQMLQMQQRGEVAPLETVEGPDGRPVLVPREQAVGRTPMRLPNTVVNNTNNLPGDTVRGRADAATLQEVQRGANDARQLVQLFDRAERAVRSVPEGTGAQLLPIVGQAARAIGIEIAGTEEAEVLRSITNGLAVLQRAPGSGATTDFEMRLYMQAVPRLGNTRAGNLQLIDMGRRLALRRMQEANIWRQHAGEPDLMERLNALPPVFTPDELRVLEGDATPTNNAQPGGRVQADPPAPVVTRPRARNNQGQVIEWNGSAWVPAQ